MKQKRLNHILLNILLLLILAPILMSCSPSDSSRNAPSIAWSTETPIEEPIKVVNVNQGATVGDISTQKVKIILLPNSLTTVTPVTELIINNPEKASPMPANQGAPISVPVSISVSDTPTRLNNLMQVTIKFDQSILPAKTTADSLWATFWDGQQWQLIQPDTVDLQAGTLTFSTGHMTLFGAAKITVDERIEKWIHSKTVANVAQKEYVDEIVNKLAETAIDNILKERLGLQEESLKYKISSSLLKDDEWGDIAKQAKTVYTNGLKTRQEDDVVGLVQTINAFAAKKLVENMDKGTLSTALKKAPGWVTVGTEAAAYLAERNYREAARIIGTKLANNVKLVKVVKASAEIIDWRINVWKDGEIEAAYKAYQNGASSKTGYGYEVDKGDFDGVWNQMRAIGEKLQIDALAAERRARMEGGQDPPSAREEQLIREKVRTNLEAEFKSRASRDDQVAKQEAELKKLMAVFKSRGLLDDASGFRYGNDNLDFRMGAMMGMRDKVLRDAKGKKVTNEDMADLAASYFSGSLSQGKAAYAALLKKKFGIDLNAEAVVLELTYPAGESPKVFTTGWVFGVRCVQDADTTTEKDMSDSVQWSGTGTFQPAIGKLSRPTFNKEGANKIVLSVKVGEQTYTKEFSVTAVSPAKYASVGTLAYSPADGHGSPGEPLPVKGPIVTGSPNVTVNNMPAARVGDTGVHAACSGYNTFEIVSGDSEVLIDGRPAARIGDRTKHCGGMGNIITGIKNELSITPLTLTGEPDKEYTFTARATNPPRDAQYVWTVNGKETENMALNFPFRTKFASAGKYAISVKLIGTDGKEIASASATADIKAAPESSTKTETNKLALMQQFNSVAVELGNNAKFSYEVVAPPETTHTEEAIGIHRIPDSRSGSYMKIQWVGSSFSGTTTEKEGARTYKNEVSGKLSSDYSVLETLSYKYSETNEVGYGYWKYGFELQNAKIQLIGERGDATGKTPPTKFYWESVESSTASRTFKSLQWLPDSENRVIFTRNK